VRREYRDDGRVWSLRGNGRCQSCGPERKLLAAAWRGGITTVLIPRETKKTCGYPGLNVKEGLTIIPVKHVSEVFENTRWFRDRKRSNGNQDAKDAAAAAALARRKPPAGDSATAQLKLDANDYKSALGRASNIRPYEIFADTGFGFQAFLG